jgi:hypothetical protein
MGTRRARRPGEALHWPARDQLLFLCSRLNFREEHRLAVANVCQQQTIDWGCVYTTAERHGVAPLVFENLRQCPSVELPPAISTAFEGSLVHSMVAKPMIRRRLTDVVAHFESLGIDLLLTKGIALEQVLYAERPWVTVANDVDLLLRCRRADVDGLAIDEFFARFEDVHFEFDYFGHHDLSMNGVLPIDFAAIWADAEQIEIEGHRALIMRPEDLLLAACINSARKRFFRLKSLVDIAEMTHAWHSTLDWDRFIDRARTFQCGNIVYAALLVTQATLGASVPNGLIRELRVHPLRARLIRARLLRTASSSLATVHAGPRLIGRPINPSLILPYLTYPWPQLLHKILGLTGARPGVGLSTLAQPARK